MPVTKRITNLSISIALPRSVEIRFREALPTNIVMRSFHLLEKVIEAAVYVLPQS